jgi:polyisoprenoid-binding protein YceI
MRSLARLPLLLAALPGLVMADTRSYEVDPARSTMRVSVGKGGLFSFAGHEHEVLATAFEGRIVADEADLSRSTVTLAFPAAGLKVSAKGEPPEDVPKVQEKMAGAEVLDMARFPTVTFRSTAVKGKAGAKGYDLEVTGELSLHGVARALTLPVHVDLAEAELSAEGHTTLRQTDYGMTPVSVAGVVKVKNELSLSFRIVARLTP